MSAASSAPATAFSVSLCFFKRLLLDDLDCFSFFHLHPSWNLQTLVPLLLSPPYPSPATATYLFFSLALDLAELWYQAAIQPQRKVWILEMHECCVGLLLTQKTSLVFLRQVQLGVMI